jgi:molybdopterin-guanine dinucleotide biosynthesis protein A
MIQRTINLLTELHLDPCVITNATRDYSFLKCRIERDLIPDMGPMGGLYAACRFFKDSSLVVLTCDMPALTPAAVKPLIKNHRKDRAATVYVRSNTFKQPFPGIYESALCDRLVASITMKRLSMQEFFKNLPEMAVVQFPFDDRLLLNINWKKDKILYTL